MKSLGKVIKAFECCDHGGMDSRCEDCPYSGIGACMSEQKTDALHYLEEYKGLSEMWNNRLDAEQENNPLTWDELKGMLGKPVWVEHKHYSKWLIVCEVYENTIVLDGNGYYTQYFSDDNDKEVRWKAYRKER